MEILCTVVIDLGYLFISIISIGFNFRCGCGRLKTDHEEGIETSLGETWSSEKHTSKRPTDSYGLLSFSEEDQDSGISTKVIILRHFARYYYVTIA